MKNATLSVLLLLLLGATWVGVAAAQADEPEGDAPSEPADPTESADDAPADDAPADDAPADDAPADDAPADDAPADDAPAVDTSADDASADDASADDASADDAPADDAPADDASAADTSTEGVTAADAAVEEAPVDGDADMIEAEPVEEPEPVEAEPPVAEEPGTDLGEPDAEDEEPAAEEPAEDAAPAAEPPAWRNTFFNYTNQVNTNTFWRGAQLSYNPTYQMAVSVVPRWYVLPTGFFRANLGFRVELTDTDGNALNREPLLNDLLIDYAQIFSLGEGFLLMPQVRAIVPLSRASLAAQRYLQTSGQLVLIKIIPEAGNLTLAVLGRYGYWFAGSNVVQTDTPQPCTLSSAPTANIGGAGFVAPDSTCGQFGTATTGRHIILAGISATMTPIGSFSINLSAFLFNSYGYDLAPAVVNVATREEPLVIQDGSPSHWRNFTYFAVSVAYQFLPWLNMSLGIQNSGIVAPAYQPNGDLYNPLFTPNTQVFLTATIGLDTLYGEIAGGGEDDLTPEERQRRQQGLSQGPSVGGTF